VKYLVYDAVGHRSAVRFAKAGQGYLFSECDYGAKVVVNIPEGIEEVGFIVRRDCSEPGGSSWGSATKDYEQDRFAILEGRETVIYLKSGDASQYISEDGGKTLKMIKKFSLAGIADRNKIQYRITPKTTISDISQIKVYDGERELEIANISTLGREAATDSSSSSSPKSWSSVFSAPHSHSAVWVPSSLSV